MTTQALTKDELRIKGEIAQIVTDTTISDTCKINMLYDRVKIEMDIAYGEGGTEACAKGGDSDGDVSKADK